MKTLKSSELSKVTLVNIQKSPSILTFNYGGNNLEGMIARLESLIVSLKNAKILHDYDNYQAALADYSYANFMAGTATPCYETKVNEMK
jgi:hypothetical protein